MASLGAYVSTRVLHGSNNAAAYYWSTIPLLFDTTRHAIKAWIDDFSVCLTTGAKLIQCLDKCFSIRKYFHLRHPTTKVLFCTKKVKCCGRIIDGKIYQLNQRNIEALRNMEAPITASKLCQFTNCWKWMRNCIPDYHKAVIQLD